MEKQPRYSGGVETRTESDSTNFEHACFRDAAEKLKKAGLLVSAQEKRLFHGRANAGDNFDVDPFYNNAGDNTGHNNINKGMSVLHVAEKLTASKFAKERAKEEHAAAEVSGIVIPDKDATFFDCRLSINQREKLNNDEIREAIKESMRSPVSNTVLDMEDYRNIDVAALKELRQSAASGSLFSSYDHLEEDWAKRLNISVDGASKLLGSINARNSILQSADPYGTLKDITGQLTGRKNILVLIRKAKDGRLINCGINREYIQQWMRDLHIIGTANIVDSATLGEDIDAYSVIQLEEAKSAKQMEKSREMRQRVFGNAALRTFQLLRRENLSDKTPLDYLNIERRASPHALIESAKHVGPKFGELFESDFGTDGDSTVEQHTEAMLRSYDASYKSSLPRSIYDLGRLCLLVRDISNPENDNRKGNSADLSVEFLKEINAPPELVEAIPMIITEGMNAANENVEKRTVASSARLMLASRKIAKKMYGNDGIILHGSGYGYADTISTLCRALAESSNAVRGAYAVTKGKKGILHHNASADSDENLRTFDGNPEYHRTKGDQNDWL